MTVRFTQYGLLAGILLMGTGLARGESPPSHPPVTLDIAPQPLSDTLNQFARQTGLQLVYHSRVAKGLLAPRIVGTLDPRETLGRLLGESGLRYEYLDADTVAILAPENSSSTAAALQTDNSITARVARGWCLLVFVESARLAATEGEPDAVRSLRNLSPSERRVALLVAEGLRNQEIARRLKRSCRTIEYQVGMIFRKLDMTRRSQLVRILAPDGGWRAWVL